jgi:murein DD-endopeptidase MepM/ murein hydrolase activator NlpD
VQVGQTVRAGQAIGTVGNYAKYRTPSHIHTGVH